MWGILVSLLFLLFSVMVPVHVPSVISILPFVFLLLMFTSYIVAILSSRIQKITFEVHGQIIHDKTLSFTLAMQLFFALAGVLFQTSSAVYNGIFQLVLCGIAFDCAVYFIKQLYKHNTPEYILHLLGKKFLVTIDKNRTEEALITLQKFVEITNKAQQQKNLSIAQQAVKYVEKCSDIYIKNISKIILQTSATLSLLDQLQVFSVFLFSRLEWLFIESISYNNGPFLERLLNTWGNTTLMLAEKHPSLIFTSLNSLRKCAHIAAKNQVDDHVNRTIIILSELAKKLLELSLQTKEEYKDYVLSLLFTIEEIVKSQLKNSTHNQTVLFMQPFAEIAELFADKRFEAFSSRDLILQEIRRILQEFSALDDVMRELPGRMQAMQQDDVSSYENKS